MNVYLAGRYAHRAELARYRDELEVAGIKVTSRWLDGPQQRRLDDGSVLGSREEGLVERLEGDEGIELAGACGLSDVNDVAAAEVMVTFTYGGQGRGGRHVEWGLAIANGAELVVVGPREHVFHCLPGLQVFEDWPAARAWLFAKAGVL